MPINHKINNAFYIEIIAFYIVETIRQNANQTATI